MSETVRLNEDVVKELAPPTKGNRVHFYAGATIQGAKVPRGFGVRVTAAGQKAFVMDYRLRGRQHRYTIGGYPDWSVLKAVRHARDLRQRIDRGEDPLDDRAPAPVAKTVSEVIDDFVARYVRSKDRPLRSAPNVESAFNRLVKPHIGKLGIYDLRRSHVAALLDRIEDETGPVAADRAKAYLRKCFGWYAERDDKFDFAAAFGLKMQPRANAKERARARVLSDDEIRLLWPLLDGASTFGALVKIFADCPAPRRSGAHAHRAEIDRRVSGPSRPSATRPSARTWCRCPPPR